MKPFHPLPPRSLKRLPWWAVPLLWLAASCPSRDEEAVPMLESSYRMLRQGHHEAGLAGYERVAERFMRVEPSARPAWVRAFMIYSLARQEEWGRVEARIRRLEAGTETLTTFLEFKGPGKGAPEAARRTLLESRFHEEVGRWSRFPAWVLPDMLRLCGDALMARARSHEPALDPIGDDMPAAPAESIARLALARAAAQFYLRAWEIAATGGMPERASRTDFVSAVRLAAGLQRDLANRSDPEGAARRTAWATQWEAKAYAAEEDAPLKSVDSVADVGFITATAQDHFVEGLRSYGAAIGANAGGGTRDRIEAMYEEALERLLVAREFKAVLSPEDAARLAYIPRAVRGIYRLTRKT
jgi:hypothetical protein